MTSPNSLSEVEAAFAQLSPGLQRWIWAQGWTHLRDIQVQAIPPILAGQSTLLMAPTASGKTEAALFPVLTDLGADPQRLALYLSPLKALINDQGRRLELLCEQLEIPLTLWHGESKASGKNRFRANPRGLVIMTPESLEAMLMREGQALGARFEHLRFALIDEVHAFIGNERGRQLQSLLFRLDALLNRAVPRIGLSATLGDARLAAEYLNPQNPDTVCCLKDDTGGRNLKLQVRAIPGDAETGYPLLAKHLHKTLREGKNLVFPNSRGQVETLTALLQENARTAGTPTRYLAHHGSLAADLRQDAEQALRDDSMPATIVATTTLELGIDVGSVEAIAQVGPPPTVSSLRQRLGRCGRREGQTAVLRAYALCPALDGLTPLTEQLREPLLQTLACVELMLNGWCEPSPAGALHLSTLVQQMLALIVERCGLTAQAAYDLLVKRGAFSEISPGLFGQVLRALGKATLVEQDAQGLLHLGPEGERVIRRHDFYCAFATPAEYQVAYAGKVLGQLPLGRPVKPGDEILFAAKRWKIQAISWETRRIEVEPTRRKGKAPSFDGQGFQVHREIRQAMRTLLATDQPLRYLDNEAETALSEARSLYHGMGLRTKPVAVSAEGIHLFVWESDAVQDGLALLLKHQGLFAENEGLCLTLRGSPLVDIREALHRIAQADLPDLADLLGQVGTLVSEKWESVLSPELQRLNYAARQLDLPRSRRLAGELAPLLVTAPAKPE